MTVFDKDKSRIKMVVLRSGKHRPITWWSIISKDNQRAERICESMLRRFNKYLQSNANILPTINKIHFYEWGKFIGEANVK